LCKKIDEKSIRKRGVRVKQRICFLLTPTYFLLIFRLACYQQAGGGGQAAETESTLALAENVYVNLPTPEKEAGKGSSFKKNPFRRWVISITK
jgi:hypothetical protein